MTLDVKCVYSKVVFVDDAASDNLTTLPVESFMTAQQQLGSLTPSKFKASIWDL